MICLVKCSVSACNICCNLFALLDPLLQYIYITLEEMRAVAQHLTKRGRISISELAAQSARLVDLEPRAMGSGGKRPMLDFETLAEE